MSGNEKQMRVAIAQLNQTIADVDGNRRRILEAWTRAREAGADRVVTPELSICGYPPKDLLDRRRFADRAARAVEALAIETADGPALIVGFPEVNPAPEGKPLFNAAAVLDAGRVRSVHRKSLLPTYDVFDEARYFEPAAEVSVPTIRGRRVGVTVCEDLWLEDASRPGRRYGRDPVAAIAAARPEVLVNISASPWHLGKQAVRVDLCGGHARRLSVPVVFCNQTGGQDDLLFDGGSFVLGPGGERRLQAASFEEDLCLWDLDGDETRPAQDPASLEMLERALVLGVRDYLRRAGGFDRVLVGLSGGIDSSVVAAIAARAVGPDRVLGVRMPSRFSSEGSLTDAEALARNLGIELETLSVEPAFSALLGTLRPVFGDRPFGVAEENLQARVRGVLLMAISNKLGHLLLTTGNKSELAVGYCTLYGDMSGGLAVISDLPKTLVYQLSEYLNRDGEVIPRSVIEKPPSAELRPDQTDQQSLPPYPVLDAILAAFVEEGRAPSEIAVPGADAAMIARVVEMVERSEYKRWQAAPGLRVTRKAFGPGRRIPLTAWRGSPRAI